MADGFKGRNVHLESIEISSTSGVNIIRAKVQFLDDNATVHGITQHRFALNPPEDGVDDGLYAAVRELHQIIVSRVEAAHFDSASVRQEVTHGIAESIKNAVGSTDDPGIQG